MVEVDGVEGLDQREVEHRQIERLLAADGAVIVPGVVRGQHHVAGSEHDVLAVDAGEIALALQAEADRARRMLVRRHDLVGVVQAIGRVHGRHGGALRRQARIDEDQRAALGIVHRYQFDRLVQDWFDVFRAAPDIRDGLLAAHQLLDLVVGDVARLRPEGKHAFRGNIVVKRLQRGIAIGQAVDVCGWVHVDFSAGQIGRSDEKLAKLVRRSIAHIAPVCRNGAHWYSARTSGSRRRECVGRRLAPDRRRADSRRATCRRARTRSCSYRDAAERIRAMIDGGRLARTRPSRRRTPAVGARTCPTNLASAGASCGRHSDCWKPKAASAGSTGAAPLRPMRGTPPKVWCMRCRG